MIKPVNGHLLIEPVGQETFIASRDQTFQEIGVVIAVPSDFPTHTTQGHSTSGTSSGGYFQEMTFPNVGDKVYFDAWLAAKYPREGGEQDDFYWLVKWEDVRAIEHAESE